MESANIVAIHTVVQVDNILKSAVRNDDWNETAWSIVDDRKLVAAYWKGHTPIGQLVVRPGDGPAAARNRLAQVQISFGANDTKSLLRDVRNNRKKAPDTVEIMCDHLLSLNDVETQQAINAARAACVARDAAEEADADALRAGASMTHMPHEAYRLHDDLALISHHVPASLTSCVCVRRACACTSRARVGRPCPVPAHPSTAL